MKLSEFDYHLPAESIAQFPAARRTSSRMLVVNRRDGSLIDSRFSDLTDFIDDSYFLVVNDSRVFKARLLGHRRTGGKVEVLLVRKLGNARWKAMLQPSGRVHKGESVYFSQRYGLTVTDDPGGVEREVEFASEGDEKKILARFGAVPLPPYIRREPTGKDANRYQTVYADSTGSVAAPTAGLHFDHRMLARLKANGVPVERVTLHVGPGTFKPVQVEDISKHRIDPELAEVSRPTATAINKWKKQGRKLLAVGTTSVRTLESAADADGVLAPFSGPVDLYIYPPYQYKVVDALLTNFHLPKSSLLMLVAAFCGRDLLFRAYGHAIATGYRFYSYGDCMLIL
ncbi:MAG: tRNA preQ1(34) S-adenosylmethionine ribosyltransferase-isomerase QueA [candidate division Zixibacteria bacterium]|nr:tRNA preQ1(34) S-adenosylmethionine ribosyltransferase-isomerase QueA [candidate division Zixibacteria bacterium]